MELAKRHLVLRANFANGPAGEPLQIIYRDKPVGFEYEEPASFAGTRETSLLG